MPITYIGGTFALHGLEIKSEEELFQLVTKIRAAIREIHTTMRVESDVEFEIEEQAGEPE